MERNQLVDGAIEDDGVGIDQQQQLAARDQRRVIVAAGKAEVFRRCNQRWICAMRRNRRSRSIG